MVEMRREAANLGKLTSFPGFLLPVLMTANLQHPQPTHSQSARQQRGLCGGVLVSSGCCAPTLGTQALGNKQGHRASQGDPSPICTPALCRVPRCLQRPRSCLARGSKAAGQPQNTNPAVTSSPAEKGAFLKFPLFISLLLLRGKIPRGRRLVANQAAEAMAMKSKV